LAAEVEKNSKENLRLAYVTATAGILLSIILLILLSIELVIVETPFYTIRITLVNYHIEPPRVETPPLQSIETISRELLVWTLVTASLLTATALRLRRSPRSMKPIIAVLTVTSALEASVAYSLLRTLYLDVVPYISRPITLGGAGWSFAANPPLVSFNPVRDYYWLLILAIIAVSLLSIALMVKLPRKNIKIAVATVALIFLVHAQAAAYAARSLEANINIGEPIIWYGDPGEANVNVLVGPKGQNATVNVTSHNRVLAIIDHNSSAGIVAQRSFVSGSDYLGRPTWLNFTWRVEGFKIISDPDWLGVVLGEAYIQTASTTHFVSVYAYPSEIDEIVLTYGNNTYSEICAIVQVPEWGINFSIVGSLTGSSALFQVYVNGVLECEVNATVTGFITAVGFDVGRYGLTNIYELYLDDIKLNLVSGFSNVTLEDSFEDGIDNVFAPSHGDQWWYDTYYLTPAGSTATPTPDGSVGIAVLAARAVDALDVYTNLDDALQIPSWLVLDSSECTYPYSPRSVPVRIEELNGTARALAWVNVTLNSTNFKDWSLLAADGSDIYFTLSDGSVTVHRIAYINVTAQEALLQVLVPSLPPYSAAVLHMHYGGVNPYPYSRVDFNVKSINEVRVIVLEPTTPLMAEYARDASNTPWIVDDILVYNGTPVRARSSVVNFAVNSSLEPNLSVIGVFAALPPGSDAVCRIHIDDYYAPGGDIDVSLSLYHEVLAGWGAVETKVRTAELGLIAGRSGTGLDTDPAYIHWIYLNLTTGVYKIRYVSDTIVRNASGSVTVIEGNFLDLQALTWDERYALGPLVVFTNPYRATQDYNVTIKDINGNNHTFTLFKLVDNPEIVVMDVLIAWEDVWWPDTLAALDNYIDHVIRLTIFANGTARVEVLFASGGFLHMFMLNKQLPDFDTVPQIVEKYVNNSYQLDPEDSVIYVKAHGDVVTSTSGQVWDPVNATWITPPLIFYVDTN